jgi:hypothetical protein
MPIAFVRDIGSVYFKLDNSVITKTPIAIPVATTNPIIAVLKFKEYFLDPTSPDITSYWIL